MLEVTRQGGHTIAINAAAIFVLEPYDTVLTLSNGDGWDRPAAGAH